MNSLTLIENHVDTQEGSATVNIATNRKTVVVQFEEQKQVQFKPQATKSATLTADANKQMALSGVSSKSKPSI